MYFRMYSRRASFLPFSTFRPQRYAHLSPQHLRSAVQRLNDERSDTTTDTEAEAERQAVGAVSEVTEFSKESSAPGGIRTPNPQIRSPIRNIRPRTTVTNLSMIREVPRERSSCWSA